MVGAVGLPHLQRNGCPPAADPIGKPVSLNAQAFRQGGSVAEDLLIARHAPRRRSAARPTERFPARLAKPVDLSRQAMRSKA